jgi:transcription termination factor Rho
VADVKELSGKKLPELQEIAGSLGLKGVKGLRKQELIDAIASGGSGNGGKGRKPQGDNGAPKSAPAKASAPADAPAREDAPQRERTQQDAPQGGGQQQGGQQQGGQPQGGQQGGQPQGGGQVRPQFQPRGQFQGGDGGGSQGGGRRNERRRRGRDRNRGRDGGGQQGGRQQQHGGGGQRGPQGMQGGDRDYTLEEAQAAGELKTGVLDTLNEGYGFLRTSGYLPGSADVYVSQSQVRRHGLRKGDEVTGYMRAPNPGEKYWALLRIESIAGLTIDEAKARPDFKNLTPLFPEERFQLEWGQEALTERVIDLVAPIGKGQRGMVVSPPKAGKTTILKQIANGIFANSPNVHLIVLLVDERPEEVTDWQRTVKAAEVVYSTFDRPAEDHTQVAELVLQRAMRLVEAKQDVVILLDSITRLARAYNLSAPASGRILSGGVDSTALYPPKRFFGAARNIEEGGSLTIIASALVETGSKMDEVIFEEFKGTGNSEIRLDRGLSEKRIFPAINVEASGTRKEELLYNKEDLMLIWRWRRLLHALGGAGQAMELLRDKLKQTPSNEVFLREIAKMKNVD